LFAKLPETLSAERSTNLYSRLAIVVNDLLLTILEELSSQKIELREHLTSSRRSVEIFLAHLKENANQAWTLEDLARECGLGVTRFIHYCKQITNRSPMAYLNECRLDSAREILEQDPKATITEVAFDCGFSSSQYFSTQFKKRFKCTPRSLRAHLKRQIPCSKSEIQVSQRDSGN
jgi:AraC family L-rhamnose operon regulatory protein RhaS